MASTGLIVGGAYTTQQGAGRFGDGLGTALREAEAESSEYRDVTKRGSRYLNKSTDVGPTEFGKNLVANGFTRTEKGPNIMYEKDGTRYFLRGKANSHSGWTADYYGPGSKNMDIKIRLGED